MGGEFWPGWTQASILWRNLNQHQLLAPYRSLHSIFMFCRCSCCVVVYCLKGDVVFVSVVAVVVFNADDVVCCRAVNKAPSQYPYVEIGMPT